ncbi:E7 early protein [Bos taurus papillomavirus 43]|nr:E7 early protein [Bos taurus papillomavirus 43]
MVAGPTCSKHLPQPKPEGVELLLQGYPDKCPNFDEGDFAKLHSAFKPGGGGYQAKPAPGKVTSRFPFLSIYFVSCSCTCHRPLKLAVRSSHESIRVFEQLLTESTFDLLCPTCGNRYYGR